MSKLRIRVSVEVESQGMDDATRRTIELRAAQWQEQLEAHLAETLQRASPGTPITTDWDEEEGEEWKGQD